MHRCFEGFSAGRDAFRIAVEPYRVENTTCPVTDYCKMIVEPKGKEARILWYVVRTRDPNRSDVLVARAVLIRS